MKKMERYERETMEYLRHNGKISIQRAMKLLDVSESTVRRMFRRLEESQQVVHIYGGIQLISQNVLDYSFEKVESHQIEEKIRIARQAVTLLRNGDMVFLDSGTTMAQFASALAGYIHEGKLRDLTIFTNSLVNLNHLSDCTRVNLIGGEYRPQRKDFCGYLAEEMVKNLHFNRCFLGTDGYSGSVGFTTTDFLTARLNELVLSCSAERIVLADYNKFLQSTVVSYSRTQKVDLVITDRPLERSVQDSLAQRGTRVLYAEKSFSANQGAERNGQNSVII